MKIKITGNKLESLFRRLGTQKTITTLGGWENFVRTFNIKSPMDFLHLFDDMKQVKSELKPDFTLFYYTKGVNILICDRPSDYVRVNYNQIGEVLTENFNLTHHQIIDLISKWFDEISGMVGNFEFVMYLPAENDYLL